MFFPINPSEKSMFSEGFFILHKIIQIKIENNSTVLILFLAYQIFILIFIKNSVSIYDLFVSYRVSICFCFFTLRKSTNVLKKKCPASNFYLVLILNCIVTGL